MDEKKFINEEEFLNSYNVDDYNRPSVTNDVIILTTSDKYEKNSRKLPKKGMQVLLIKRDQYPDKECFSFPGGFVHMDEGLEDGARRKLFEKTGIKDVYIEQLYTYGDVNRDKRTRVITVANFALVEKESINELNDDYTGKWFWVEKNLVETKEEGKSIIKIYEIILKSEDEKDFMCYKIKEVLEKNIIRKREATYEIEDESNGRLAFDHIKLLDGAIDRLRNKVEYTQIAFNLLPRLFTVKELQNVYEAIMGKEILNFRRKMGDMIIETDEKIEGKPFRPAQVYKFNEDWEHIF
ncbi:MAG: NUDIX hydrolase [Clostridium sp.]